MLMTRAIKTTIIGAMLYMGCSVAQAVDPIITDSTSTSTTTIRSDTNSVNKSESTVKSPPASAISPAITTINNDVCTVAVSGAVQTQILGISGGGTTRDLNCERIKLAKNLYDMGMKVAAVSTLCQDERVFTAMMNAGTPCPVDGQIGESAKRIWQEQPERKPKAETKDDPGITAKDVGIGALILGILAAIL